MINKNISIVRGDTLSFGVNIVDQEKQPLELETAYFTCKKTKDDAVPTFQKSLNNGIEKASNGLYKVRVAPDDTKEVEAGKYYYDLQIGANDDVYTIMMGILEIEQGITE